jgi:hypothetical protein
MKEQDFTRNRKQPFSSAFSNLQSVMVNDLEDELSTQNQGKKYNYKVNTNLSYGFLKNRIIDLLWQGSSFG